MSVIHRYLYFWNWNWKGRLLMSAFLSGVFFFYIQPHLSLVQLEPSIKKLENKYDLTIEYNDPENFPKPFELENFEIQFKEVEKKLIPEVLKGMDNALRIYPPQLIKKYLSKIFIVDKITINGVSGAAAYGDAIIFIAANLPFGRRSSHEYGLSIHHEFSSLLFNGSPFPWMDWSLANHGDFKYLERYEDILKAADLKNRKDPKLSHKWYDQGFVSDYGMTSMQNDFNKYAELAFADPQKLRELAQTYPRIAKKTELLVKFYTRLAPEMCDYFKSNGLTAGCNKDESSG